MKHCAPNHMLVLYQLTTCNGLSLFQVFYVQICKGQLPIKFRKFIVPNKGSFVSTNGRTDKPKAMCPFNFFKVGGIKNLTLKILFFVFLFHGLSFDILEKKKKIGGHQTNYLSGGPNLPPPPPTYFEGNSI